MNPQNSFKELFSKAVEDTKEDSFFCVQVLENIRLIRNRWIFLLWVSHPGLDTNCIEHHKYIIELMAILLNYHHDH